MATRRPDPIPPSLRRSANRPGGPRTRRPSPRLIEAARAGVLSDANTRKGTAGRRAVDAVTYDRRQARGRRLGVATARAAVGHGGALPSASITAMFRNVGFATVENPTAAERRRLARWNARAGELRQGFITPARFRRLVGSWAEFRGQRLESDPDVVLATLSERSEAGETLFEYVGRRT